MYPEVGLLDYMLVLFLISQENFIPFSIVAAPAYIPTNSAQHCMMSLICEVLKKKSQTHRNREQKSDCQGLEWGKQEEVGKGVQTFSFMINKV